MTADVDASVLWKGAITDEQLQRVPPGSAHEVTVTGLEYDDNGNVTNVIINDTGTGQCSRYVPVGQWNKAVNALYSEDKKTGAHYAPFINITKSKIF